MKTISENVLSDLDVDMYRNDGFLVIKNLIPGETCDHLRSQASDLVAGFDLEDEVSIFSTNEQARKSDRYFLESGNRIRFFFEEGAFGSNGELVRPKEYSINKIGHALHELDPVFRKFSTDEYFVQISLRLGLRKPRIVQSMYIFKQPGIGGEVTCHQDSTFLYTDPPSVIGLWFALEDSTVNNGCLWALPGGHKAGLKSRFIRDGFTTRFEAAQDIEWDEDAVVPLEVKKGSLIILDGMLPHLSRKNESSRSRHAYTLHFIDAGAAYPTTNWLQLNSDPAES